MDTTPFTHKDTHTCIEIHINQTMNSLVLDVQVELAEPVCYCNLTVENTKHISIHISCESGRLLRDICGHR